jgi:hypothetical protein
MLEEVDGSLMGWSPPRVRWGVPCMLEVGPRIFDPDEFDRQGEAWVGVDKGFGWYGFLAGGRCWWLG